MVKLVEEKEGILDKTMDNCPTELVDVIVDFDRLILYTDIVGT